MATCIHSHMLMAFQDGMCTPSRACTSSLYCKLSDVIYSRHSHRLTTLSHSITFQSTTLHAHRYFGLHRSNIRRYLIHRISSSSSRTSTAKMKILFLCTAHNSLSQRLYLALSPAHDITIEYALSDELMVSAAALAKPDLIICPFLTTLVPQEVYDRYLTLIVHPGPPGDAGPSALDWVLLGDDGSIDDAQQALKALHTGACAPGRSHWGVTILQAIEEFDAGPVWAFDQFAIDIDEAGLTKSELYRSYITQAAIAATLAAVLHIQTLASGNPITPFLTAPSQYGHLSVTASQPFQGGKTHHRPLLKAAERDFDLTKHTSQHVSRSIRCGDSQPGAMSKCFGRGLYVYGGQIEDGAGMSKSSFACTDTTTVILGVRNGAVCVKTVDGGIWITHVRRLKSKSDNALWPKVPATTALVELGILNAAQILALDWPLPSGWALSPCRTFQEVYIDFDGDVAYLYFDFYNGAMSSEQCSQLIAAMEYIITRSSTSPVKAVVLMGGSYFSNGIHLNVIEASSDPSMESWLNINRINDVVYFLLHDFSACNIATVSAIRSNAAAGGVALATACDVVIAGADVVLNPAYRAVGLSGSEYHTV